MTSTAVDLFQFQAHVIGTDIPQLKHPGFDREGQGPLDVHFPHQVDRQTMRINEIPIHKDMADPPLQDQRPQEQLELVHLSGKGNTLVGRKPEFVERKTDLNNGYAFPLQIAGEPCKKHSDWTHQQENRPLNGNGFHQ
jgi:hypothetical protein